MQEITERSGRGRRTAAVTAVAAVALLAGGAALWARDGGGDDRQEHVSAPPATTGEAPGTPTAADPEPEAPAAPAADLESESGSQSGSQPGSQSGSPRGTPALADGRHPVLLTDFDVAGSTVEFDLVQYLTGDEAHAYVDHDQYVLNESPRRRTLPVTAGVDVTVLQTAESTNDPHAIPFGELPGYVGPDRALANVFWLTVRDGTVVAIDEQYSP